MGCSCFDSAQPSRGIWVRVSAPLNPHFLPCCFRCLSVVEGSENEVNENISSMKGYMYILKCADGSYYTGSTKNLVLRIAQHQAGLGANHTKKHLPVELVYYEIHSRIDKAFYREKQVQGWSRNKKEALIANRQDKLHLLAECQNATHYKNASPAAFGSAQAADATKA